MCASLDLGVGGWTGRLSQTASTSPKRGSLRSQSGKLGQEL
jgi:hypothetical protein